MVYNGPRTKRKRKPKRLGSKKPPVPSGWRRVWVPFSGWRLVGPDERERVDRRFQTPMLVLALLALPVFTFEFWMPVEWLGWPAVAWSIDIAMGVIWLAFLVEFVIKISIAESRLRYVVKNWLDLVIILLPFLRPLRGVAAMRSLRLARMLQVFSIRGVAMKALRATIAAALGLELIKRLSGVLPDEDPAVQKERRRLAEMSRSALIEEIHKLNRHIKELEEKLLATAARPNPDKSDTEVKQATPKEPPKPQEGA